MQVESGLCLHLALFHLLELGPAGDSVLDFRYRKANSFFFAATKCLLSYSGQFFYSLNNVVCLLLAPVRENQKWRQKNRAFLYQDELPVHLAVGGDRGVLRRPLHDDAGEDGGGGDSQGMIKTLHSSSHTYFRSF